jgi:hypothetical protein
MSSEGAPRPPAEVGAGWLGKADLWAGMATIAFALAALYLSADYGLGRAGRIGAGYVPLVVGLLLLGLGLLLVIRSGRSRDPVDTDIAWRPLLLVTAGIVTFALLLDRVGLMAAIIATVVVAGPAALGNTLVSMLVSGLILSAFSWALFVYFLKISIPVWWF